MSFPERKFPGVFLQPGLRFLPRTAASSPSSSSNHSSISFPTRGGDAVPSIRQDGHQEKPRGCPRPGGAAHPSLSTWGLISRAFPAALLQGNQGLRGGLWGCVPIFPAWDREMWVSPTRRAHPTSSFWVLHPRDPSMRGTGSLPLNGCSQIYSGC